MKTLITLSILLSFVFSCQAESYIMRARFTHEETDTVVGRITGEFISEKQTRHFDLGQNFNVLKNQKTIYHFISSYPIDSVKLLWKTKTEHSLSLNPIFISLEYNGHETNTTVFIPEKDMIGNGETVIFNKH